MGFINLKPAIEDDTPYVLTIEEKQELVEVYAVTYGLAGFLDETVKRGIHYDRNALVTYFFLIKNINKEVISVMNNQDIQTIVQLRSSVYTSFGSYSEVAINYVTDKCVLWSNGIGDNTWSEFLSYFENTG
jgi:hypothetical protein